MKDDLGDRMKNFERQETDRRLDPFLPVYARIDGRGFSRFTRGMDRPFSKHFMDAMRSATAYVVEQTHARIGYTQSDEISIIWLTDSDKETSSMFFDGKVQKICSVVASMTTVAFNDAIRKTGGDFVKYLDRFPHFDCRVFNLPSETEGANAMLWRVNDCNRNAISMSAYAEFPHKELHGVNTKGMLAKMDEAGIEYQNYPAAFRHGTFVTRKTVTRTLGEEEWFRIPEAKRPPRDQEYQRGTIEFSSFDFAKAKNRVGIVFNGEEPRFD